MPRYAAIDIGSNSVRMLAADVLPGGKIVPLGSEREVTRLGESVFRTGSISNEAMDLVCSVLARMAAAYRKFDVVGVRAVATAAVRDASNQQTFLERASAAIGSRVETISGQEEARLIHVGVQSQWPHPKQRVLIVDVGGGSAEMIVAENGRLSEAVSRPLGAVRLSGMFLGHDPPADIELERLHDYIEEKLAVTVARVQQRRVERVIATSATSAALVCAVNRIPRSRRESADRMRATVAQVRTLYKKLVTLDVSKRARLTGIGPRRAQIIVPGVAVLLRVLQDCRLPSLYYSTAGVREGIVADLAGRRVGSELSELSRDQRRVVEQMARRYASSFAHVRHVAGFGRVLFDTLKGLHGLPPSWGKLLEAAAYLYDTGHFVSDTGHHKHSAYLVRNSELPGFTDYEKLLVSLLCRFHRKSMPSARHADFQQLPPEDRQALLRLIPLLRIADALDRSKEQQVREIGCEMDNGLVRLQIKGAGKLELEMWAGSRAGETFQQVYGRPIEIVRSRR